jgi:hypothetical protein
MFYPSVVIVGLALLALILVQRAGLPPLLFFVLSIVALAFVLKDHLAVFGDEYKSQILWDGLRMNAPVAFIILSVFIALGYLLLLKNGGPRAAPPTTTFAPSFLNFGGPQTAQRDSYGVYGYFPTRNQNRNRNRNALLEALEYAV